MNSIVARIAKPKRRAPSKAQHKRVAANVSLTLLALPALLIASTTAAANNPKPARWTMGTGAHWLSGDYGLTESTYLRAFPLSLTWRQAPWKFKLNTSYVGITGPGSLVDGNPNASTNDSQNDPNNTNDTYNNRDSATGIGDTTLTLTWQKPHPLFHKVWADFSLGIKLPTADEDKGLGTGATDYRLKLDLAKRWRAFTGFSTVGYKFRGTSTIRPLDDAPWVTLGMTTLCGKRQRCGFFYDHTWPAIDTNSARSELTFFWQRAWTKRWKTTLYILGGLNEDSPDIGAGLQLKYLLSPLRNKRHARKLKQYTHSE